MKWGRFLYQPIDLTGACLSPNIITTTQAPFLEIFCGSTHCHIVFSSCYLPSEQFWSKQQQQQQDWNFIKHPEAVLIFLEQKLFSPNFLNILVSTFKKYLKCFTKLLCRKYETICLSKKQWGFASGLEKTYPEKTPTVILPPYIVGGSMSQTLTFNCTSAKHTELYWCRTDLIWGMSQCAV